VATGVLLGRLVRKMDSRVNWVQRPFLSKL